MVGEHSGAFSRLKARSYCAKRRVNMRLTFTRWSKTQLQINAYLALYLQDAKVGNYLLTCSPYKLHKVIIRQCCVSIPKHPKTSINMVLTMHNIMVTMMYCVPSEHRINMPCAFSEIKAMHPSRCN